MAGRAYLAGGGASDARQHTCDPHAIRAPPTDGRTGIVVRRAADSLADDDDDDDSSNSSNSSNIYHDDDGRHALRLASMTAAAVAAFDRDGAAFAVALAGGRICVWQCRTRRIEGEYALPLGNEVACLAWADRPPKQPGARAKRAHVGASASRATAKMTSGDGDGGGGEPGAMLMLGTTGGHLVLCCADATAAAAPTATPTPLRRLHVGRAVAAVAVTTDGTARDARCCVAGIVVAGSTGGSGSHHHDSSGGADGWALEYWRLADGTMLAHCPLSPTLLPSAAAASATSAPASKAHAHVGAALWIARGGARAVVAVASTMWLVAPTARRLRARLVGHARPVQQICAARDERVLIACAAGDRFVALWDLHDGDPADSDSDGNAEHDETDRTNGDDHRPRKSKSKSKSARSVRRTLTASAFLLAHADVLAVDACDVPASADTWRVLALTTDGTVDLWQCCGAAEQLARDGGDAAGAAPRPAAAHVRITAQHRRRTVVPVLAVRFATADTLQLAFGSPAQPYFDMLACVDASGALCDVAVERSDDRGRALLGDTAGAVPSRTGSSADATDGIVLNPSQMRVSGGLPETAYAAARQRASDPATAEPTMAERLRARNEAQQRRSKAAAGVRAPAAAEDAVPRAESMAEMLAQALRSGDQQLLEDCLNRTNEAMVRATLLRLPATAALPLLREAVKRLQARPGRGPMLAVWIRTLLHVHTAHLMAIPGLSEELGDLYQLLDARVAVFPKLLKLSGRLGLLLAQVAERGEPASGDTSAVEALSQPQVVYEDDETDDASDHVDDAMAADADAEDGAGSQGDEAADDEDAEVYENHLEQTATQDDDGGGNSDDADARAEQHRIRVAHGRDRRRKRKA